MTTPSIHFKIHISTDGLVFLRGGCRNGPPTLASVNMIVAKTIKELSRIVYYTEKPKFYILYEAAEVQITAKIVLLLC